MSMLANEFSKNSKLAIHVILYGKESPIDYALSDNVKVLQPTAKFNDSVRLISTLKRMRYLRTTLRRGAYDAILSFGERWNNFVLLACLGLDLNIFLSDRSSPRINLGAVQTGLRKLLYPRAAGLIAQTTQAREVAAQSSLNNRICVIPNPVAEEAERPEIPRDRVILSVGRMVTTKHFDRLLKIFSMLDDVRWKLIIVGDDAQGQSHRTELEALAHQLEISERVEFAGNQSDVHTYYARARIFAFTSSSEGFPNVVAEALSAGVPVVSYDCQAGPSDLIEDGVNGYLVNVFDDNAFCKRLKKVMTSGEQWLTMSENARRSVAHLRPSMIAANLIDFLLPE